MNEKRIDKIRNQNQKHISNGTHRTKQKHNIGVRKN